MSPEAQGLTTKIGLRLRAVRNAQKISLQQLSDRTGGGLSKSRISNYEQGLRRLGIEEALILSETLGTVSATYLLCLDDEGFLTEQEQVLCGASVGQTSGGRRRFLRWRSHSPVRHGIELRFLVWVSRII